MHRLALVFSAEALFVSEQISMNVRMVLTVVMRMQTVLILMVATPAPVQ